MCDAKVAEVPVVTREKLLVGTTNLEAIAQDKRRRRPDNSRVRGSGFLFFLRGKIGDDYQTADHNHSQFRLAASAGDPSRVIVDRRRVTVYWASGAAGFQPSSMRDRPATTNRRLLGRVHGKFLMAVD